MVTKEFPDIYCLKCKTHTKNKNVKVEKSKNNRDCLKAKCEVCDSNKNRFLSSNKKGGSFLSSVFNVIPEMHMKTNSQGENVDGGEFNNTGKYSYCGPGTKFDKRKKQGYKGINELDKACFKHDEVYNSTSEQKLLNLADNELVKQASKIANDPNVDENQRNSAKLVMMIISAKSYLGLGISDTFKNITRKKNFKI
mgnify:CR=1 FL=1